MEASDTRDNSGAPGPLERTVFFSDAVVAIAITLLALELPVPEGRSDAEVLRHVLDSRNEYVAFLISFAVVGTQWLVHNRLLAGVVRAGGRLMQWNLLWLLTIVATPFVTKVLTADGAFASRFIAYAAVQMCSGMVLWCMLRDIVRHDLLSKDATGQPLAAIRWRLATMVAAFLLSIPLAPFTHWAYLCWLVVPVAVRGGRVWMSRRRPR